MRTRERAGWLGVVALGAVMTLTSGCAGCIERVAPDKVAAGVARLSVRHSAIVAKVVESDTTCGFASDIVQRGVLVQGQPGQEGAVTYTVTNCTISFSTLRAVTHDCVGVEATVKGSLTVSAKKRIVGTVTGNPDKPIIPSAADAVTVEIDATFDNLEIHKSDSPSALNTVSGSMHFVVEPRVGLSKSLGVCAVPTLDLSVRDLRYDNAKLIVFDGDHVFPVDVPSADVVAQIGKWREHENDFSGTVTVWETPVTLPLPGDPEGLDPSYTAKGYFDSVACDPDLVTPVSYACPSLREQVVHGAARLSINHLGTVASLVDADTRCGFSSPAVLAQAQVSGTVGGPGSVTFTLPAPCTISFPTDTRIDTDCVGLETHAQGTVTVTGTKTLTGILTADTAQPVAPNSKNPATLALQAQFDRFKVWNPPETRSLTAVSGRLSGTLKPQVALDVRSDICSNTTPIVEFSQVQWSDAQLSVLTEGLTFEARVSQGSLEAQSGTKGDRTNYLSGVMVSDGVPVTIPPVGASPVLDPSFDAAAFERTFSCAPGFKLAADDAACSVDKALATNAARLVVLATGTITSLIQNDTNCGFSALLVKTNPTSVTGDDGQPGTIRWDLQSCRVGQTGVVDRGGDCIGGHSYVSGTADVTAQRVVNGLRNTAYLLFDSIIPKTRDAMTITLQRVNLTEFSAYSVDPGSVAPYAQLTIHGGTLTAQVRPGLGERQSTLGTFDVATPVATFTDVQLTNATAELAVAGKRFTLVLPALQVSALNGSLNGHSNELSGSVSLGGTVIAIPAGTPLNPAFNQSTFDASYACTADLASVIPPN